MSWAGINGEIATYIFFFNIMTSKYQTLDLPFKALRAVSRKDFYFLPVFALEANRLFRSTLHVRR